MKNTRISRIFMVNKTHILNVVLALETQMH